MAGVGITINIRDDGVRKLFDRFQRLDGDLPRALDVIGEDLANIVRLKMDEEQDPYGESWEELAEKTVKNRKKGDGSGRAKILRDTSRLFNSITHEVIGGSLRVGTDVEYGRVHQFGYPQGNIPRRSFLPLEADGPLPEDGLPDEWQHTIENRILEFLSKVA